ncbi:LamG-like jellyroll fold domain-containing protein [Alteromonas macleodii]|uniref:LamG-like jellyroll fold domain-containing protein n=1 Tax=Alteromonas macleodii TaxID=28108 RepID=UPI002076BB74|nr:LamG-like jellyroll fold domain-containing protein [Alteromonas macleodii]USI27434.1 FecR domain-containing protein [Alteromonas macleodii]
MQTFEPTKQQQALIAAYLAGEDVSERLLKEIKREPELLPYIATLVAQDRLLAGEVDTAESSQLFCREVQENIESANTTSLSNVINERLLERQNANNWVNKPWLMAASIFLLMGAVFTMSFIEGQRGIATVTKVAATSTIDPFFSLGKAFGAGELHLSEGYSELTLENGVVLVLEAPVSLTLNSPDRVTVSQGRLVARVPKNAIGFRIDTPSAEIVDLGTEFGVDVSQSGDSQVHVLEGEIKARADRSQSFQHVKKDEALAFNLADKIEQIANQPKAFMRVLPGNSAVRPNFLHWSFDERESQLFASRGRGMSAKSYPAKDESEFEPVMQINGVFGNAIALNGEGNWLSTEYPGVANDNPRTVSFWVKVPQDFSIDNAYGIVSWGLQQNYASWQISPNPELSNGEIGRLRIGTYNAQVVGSTDLRDGKWHHVAVVLYGGESSNISTHVLLFVDGKLEKTQNKSIAKVNTQLNHPDSRPLSVGRNIGYHPHADHETQDYFKGAIDELYIFEAALTQAQIQALMKENSVNL